ncbi:MAG: hypothetical protein JJT94_09315 [Bernardetiaceae bacterium]|nr:hypothetical protein [Bernardetiaceae bacterium]
MNNKNRLPFKSPDDFLHKLNLIFYTAIAIPLLIFLWTWRMYNVDERPTLFQIDNHWLGIWVLIVVLLLAYAQFYYQKHIKDAKSIEALSSKLLHYWRVSLWRYGFAALSALFAVVGFLLFNQKYFSWILMVTILYFSQIRPTLHSVARSVYLDANAQKKLLEETKSEF